MRIHYMDSLRSVLIIMGIFLHAANIYHVDGSWMITDTAQAPFFNHLTYAIHQFRLPGFFVLSGYFSLMLYYRYGCRKYMILRMRQLVIPLVVIALTLNIFQATLLYYSGFAFQNKSVWLASYFFDSFWISHLWFLMYLVIYVIIMGAVLPLIEKLPFSTTNRIADIYRSKKWLVYFSAPFVFVAIKVFSGIFPSIFQINFIGFWMIDFMNYACFFAFGILMFRHQGMLDSLINRYNQKAILIAVIAWFLLQEFKSDTIIYKILHNYFYYFNALVIVFLCWNVFYTFFDKKNRWVTMLSQSCYTIYLFHHIIVIGLGLLLIPLEISPYIKFSLVVTGTLLLSFAIHVLVVERSILAKLLINGRYSHAKKL